MSYMPSLMLLPGLICDARLWTAQQQAFSDKFHIHIPELFHHQSIPEMASHALAAAPESFALAGLSMGGYVALEIMRQAPERVTHFALIDSSARPDSDEQIERRKALIALCKQGRFKGVTPRLLPTLLHQNNLDNHAITQTIFDMAAHVGAEGFIRQQTAILNRIDSRETLPSIRQPTLIVVGRQDALTPPHIAEESASLLPNATLRVIEECGHLPPLEQPEQLNQIMLEWLS